MKRLLSFILLLLSRPAAAQSVGIGTITPTDQLHTTGTVRFEGYKGPGSRLVQIDSAGRMIVTGAGAVSTATPYSAIPDNGCATGNGVTSTINITGMAASVSASRMAVRVNITHPADNDLRIMLVGPNGTALLLMGGTANSGANFTNTVFTDAAQGNITGSAAQAPYTGKYKPVGANINLCLISNTLSSFSAFGGGSIMPNGAWTLKVYDGVSSNNGILNSWDISFSGPESFLTAEQNNYVPVFNKGNLDASSIYQNNSGNIGIRTVTPLTTLHVADQSEDIVTLENTSNLSSSTNTFLDFKTGNNYTGRIGTAGTDAQSASLGFYTAAGGTPAGLQKRMSILDGGNVGIGIADASVSERVHIDGGNIKLGLAAWGSAASDRFLKFGDGNYVTIGETGADDRMQLTASQFVFKRLSGSTMVGINTTSAPAYSLDVTGDLRTTSNATIQGAAQVVGALSTSSNLQVSGTVKIAGGSPAAGKVLTTTDASGNAVWSGAIAFRGRLTSSASYSSSVNPVNNYTADFNQGSAFDASTGYFTAPVAGIYHFDVKMAVQNTCNNPYGFFLGLSPSGNTTGSQINQVIDAASGAVLQLSDNLSLTAGQTVSVGVGVNSSLGSCSFTLQLSPFSQSSFSGFLVR